MTGIPNNEIIWLQRTSKDGTLYYVTSKALRDTYYIYEIIDNKATKIGKGPNPSALELKFIKE